MATLGEIRADVRSRLDETVQAFWTDTELDRWIHEALRDVARRTETLQAVKTYTTEVGRLQYDAPDDQLRIYRVEYAQSSGYIQPLEFRPFNEMDDVWYMSRDSQTGVPLFWTYWGFPSETDRAQLYIFPAPSDAITDALRVFYYRLPRKLIDDNSICDIPSGWEDLIPLYVEVLGRRKDNDRRWEEAQTLYEGRVDQLVAVTRHWSDQQNFLSAYPGVGWWE